MEGGGGARFAVSSEWSEERGGERKASAMEERSGGEVVQ